jgi:hypothetical protein
MARADKALQDIKSLRPDGFSLDQLDDELLAMTLIRALPAEYNNFASSLLLLDSLEIQKLKSAFHNEESQRLARSVSTSTSLAFQSAAASSSNLSCTFCNGTSHSEKDCFKKKKASEVAKKELSEWKAQKKGKPKQKKQDAQEASTPIVEQGNSAKIEFAGHASTLQTSHSSNWHKSHSSSLWNTDTGATSHMTPHQHWFKSYSPHVVPIRLADHTIIYSAGIGSVEFQPMIGGIPKTPVVFHEVLHVPKLASNLLSILYLTRLKGYRVVIENDQLEFFNSNNLHFTATVNDHNVGYLNGHVLIPQSANAASTCPLDLTLWHRRCSHLNFADLKHMHLHKSVLGMSLDSQSPPDPICEPCILGKQHRHNIPKTASRKSSLLALVHTDLKGPLPVQTQQGYQYWQPFVDDKSRFITLAFLKCKSKAFDAFK